VAIDRLLSSIFGPRDAQRGRTGTTQDSSASPPTSGTPPLKWQLATVKAIRSETPSVKTFTLTLPGWVAHRPGQHYDVRLTAPDGYQAQRSYSIASEPERTGEIDLTVERLTDGEVSAYMDKVLVPGDLIELRGPIGGYFVWQASMGGPLLLIAGGSGVVPLMSMLRHRAAAGSTVPTRLLYSSRSLGDVIYFEELEALAAASTGLEVFHTLTRQHPADWTGYARRIDREMIEEVLRPIGTMPRTYVCGPTPMVEAAANWLVQAGVPQSRILTERFGPTGGTT
jgi:ferredoxin-NADP reductase